MLRGVKVCELVGSLLTALLESNNQSSRVLGAPDGELGGLSCGAGSAGRTGAGLARLGHRRSESADGFGGGSVFVGARWGGTGSARSFRHRARLGRHDVGRNRQK